MLMIFLLYKDFLVESQSKRKFTQLSSYTGKYKKASSNPYSIVFSSNPYLIVNELCLSF